MNAILISIYIKLRARQLIMTILSSILRNKDFCYQIYIAPKSLQLLDKNEWRQNRLESIHPKDIKLVGENEQIKLYDVNFFIY
ncbi:hypothetical protein G8J22_00657 [Lentilactobacillus hilgardii]|nr:hypothetical protein G8J22_00657 [Lentilactobacillus hilgardii]